ncbi:PPM-type phosphatase domain-containing protein [Plasmodiophora brassicae]
MSGKFAFWPMSSKKKAPPVVVDLDSEDDNAVVSDDGDATSSTSHSAAERPFKSVSSVSHVGYVAFNPGKVNQDRLIRCVDFAGRPDAALFGVFDGHGVHGHDVSEFVSHVLPLKLMSMMSADDDDLRGSLTNAFLETADALESNKKINSTYSGTTAVVSYVTKDKIVTANAGDSRAVLGRGTAEGSVVAIPLSVDHKPDRADEKDRIVRNRGRVQPCRGPLGEPVGPARVWLYHQDIPGLAMTRSFGDTVAKSIGVIAEPEVTETARDEADRFLVIATDGVWEFIDSQQAVDIVARCATAGEACRALLEESTKRWKAEEDVIDDITVVVVTL